MKRSRPKRPVGPGAGRRVRVDRPRNGWARARAAVVECCLNLPRGAGLAATAFLILISGGYGAVRGDHVSSIVDWGKDVRDRMAEAAGFGISSVSLSGLKQVTSDEVFAAAGINGHASLLFFDVDQARARLKANPWIVDATVQKLFPNRLEIRIEERDAFALWQTQGKVTVIAADGTVVAPVADARLAALPFVVGRGADTRARSFLSVLDRYPEIRDQVRASILVAERRWNLRLKNGIDVRLPEADVEQALGTLASLDREKKLLTRDITAVDLRLPDRVTVRLSDSVAQAREDALKDKKTKRKGGDA